MQQIFIEHQPHPKRVGEIQQEQNKIFLSPWEYFIPIPSILFPTPWSLHSMFNSVRCY